MDSVNTRLRIFEIPETLDWRSLLRPPGSDYINFLDASEVEDPESWTEVEFTSAINSLSEVNFKNVGDCLVILTPEVFNVVFNLNRSYSNLEKQNQIILCQFLGSLCSRVQTILESIPPKPYSSDKNASTNLTYIQLINKIASFTTQSGGEAVDEEEMVTPETNGRNKLSVGPKSLGVVLRSLINVSVFLICMCYKFAVTFERNEEKSTFDITKDKAKRGRKNKKNEGSTKVNTMAVETVIEGLITCSKYNLKYPHASCYGGSNRPSVSMLRLLFLSQLHTLSLDESIYSVSKNMIQSIAKVIRVNFTTMQSNKITHPSITIKTEADAEKGDINSAEKETNENMEEDDEGVENLEKEVESDNVGCEYDDEWLGMLVDEMKKDHCQVIVDVLELLRDSNIPNIIVNELFYNIKENYQSQISNTNQLISSLVQNEFTNIGLFFEKLAKKVPCVVLSNMGQLKQLFDVPCYPLRKSIMEAIKLLIILSKEYDPSGESGEISNMEGMEEDNNLESLNLTKDEDKYRTKVSKLCCRDREMLLEIIISRQFDCYMYARACVLKVLHDIIESDALPVRKYNLVASFAVERIMDRGSQVRQRALSLLSLIIEVVTNNKFMLQLNTAKLKFELEAIDSNINKVNFLLSELSVRRYSLSSDSSKRDSGSPTRQRSREGSFNYVDAREYDYDSVLSEFKSDFGDDVMDKLEDIQGKLEVARELYTDAIDVSERTDECLELCKSLLKSPTETDQRAAIRFICSSHLFGIEKATKMLQLVWSLSWSNNPNVVEAVLVEFKNVYFQSASESISLDQTCNLLIDLINTTDNTCLASVEKIFQIAQSKQNLLNINLLKLIPPLVSIATMNSGLDSAADLLKCKISLNLIKVILSSNQSSVASQGQNNNELDLTSQASGKEVEVEVDELQCDVGVFRDILKRYNESILLEVTQVLIYFKDDPSLQEFIHEILTRFVKYFGNLSLNWFQIAQSVIDLTFTHIPNPLNLWSSLIKELLDELISEGKDESRAEGVSEVRKLSHLLFISGHVAIRSMIYVEKVQNDLKVRRANMGDDQVENNMGIATRDEKEREFFDHIIEYKLVNDNLLGGPILSIITQAIINPQQFTHADPHYHTFNYFQHLYLDSKLKKSDDFNLLYEGGIDFCFECNVLFMCSVISFCKFATVSKTFCNFKLVNNQTIIQTIISLLLFDTSGNEKQMDLQSNISDSTKDGCVVLNILKCNLLICYGDLLVRHPNIMEPMNDYVFRLLSHPVNMLRETAILVFSHLVMNDMIKPKGKLLDNVMFLTQDSDEKIANYARVFLNEIHRKNPNTIYNCFPEMLSTLSQPSPVFLKIINYQPPAGEIDDTGMKGIEVNLKILNEVFNFVKNDKQEHLVEKICARLNKSRSIFTTTVYINSLLLINYDEKNIIKLSKSLNLLRQLLSESEPLLAALSIIHKRIKSSKVQKVQGQVDIKEVADEMISKVKSILGQGKGTMLIRASKYAEKIIEMLNNGKYTQTNVRTMIDEEEKGDNLDKVKKEQDDEVSSNTADYESSVPDDYTQNEQNVDYDNTQEEGEKQSDNQQQEGIEKEEIEGQEESEQEEEDKVKRRLKRGLKGKIKVGAQEEVDVKKPAKRGRKKRN